MRSRLLRQRPCEQADTAARHGDRKGRQRSLDPDQQASRHGKAEETACDDPHDDGARLESALPKRLSDSANAASPDCDCDDLPLLKRSLWRRGSRLQE